MGDTKARDLEDFREAPWLFQNLSANRMSQWSEARWTKNFSHQKSLAMHHAMRFTHGPTYLGLQPSQVMDRQLLSHTLFLLRREMET